MAARVARLSQGQLDCLRLVRDNHSSKEIAAALGISPHTVDQRIRSAIHTLGVAGRNQAARLVARYEGPQEGPAPADPGAPVAPPAVILVPSLALPFATRTNPSNEMSALQKLFWIGAIAVVAAFSAGMYLAGLESLSRLLKG